MSKIGFVVNSLSDQSFVSRCNELLEHDIEPIVFYNEYGLTQELPRFARFQQCQMWGFYGPVICFDLNSANKLLNSPGPTQKYLFVYELEWEKLDNFNWQHLHNIYCNKDIELIANNQELFKTMKEYWKQPVGVCEELNIKDLMKIIWNK